MRLRIKPYMGKGRIHKLLFPLCAQRQEREASGMKPFLHPHFSWCLVVTCLLFTHPPASSYSLLGEASQRCQLTAWVQSKPVQGSCVPRRTCAPGREMAMSRSRPILLVYSALSPVHSHITSLSLLLFPFLLLLLLQPASCACSFLSLLLFPFFPFCFFPPSSCFLNEFQIGV